MLIVSHLPQLSPRFRRRKSTAATTTTTSENLLRAFFAHPTTACVDTFNRHPVPTPPHGKGVAFVADDAVVVSPQGRSVAVVGQHFHVAVVRGVASLTKPLVQLAVDAYSELSVL